MVLQEMIIGKYKYVNIVMKRYAVMYFLVFSTILISAHTSYVNNYCPIKNHLTINKGVDFSENFYGDTIVLSITDPDKTLLESFLLLELIPHGSRRSL